MTSRKMWLLGYLWNCNFASVINIQQIWCSATFKENKQNHSDMHRVTGTHFVGLLVVWGDADPVRLSFYSSCCLGWCRPVRLSFYFTCLRWCRPCATEFLLFLSEVMQTCATEFLLYLLSQVMQTLCDWVFTCCLRWCSPFVTEFLLFLSQVMQTLSDRWSGWLTWPSATAIVKAAHQTCLACAWGTGRNRTCMCTTVHTQCPSCHVTARVCRSGCMTGTWRRSSCWTTLKLTASSPLTARGGCCPRCRPRGFPTTGWAWRCFRGSILRPPIFTTHAFFSPCWLCCFDDLEMQFGWTSA